MSVKEAREIIYEEYQGARICYATPYEIVFLWHHTEFLYDLDTGITIQL